MLLFMLWSLAMVLTLTGAGYSHYRYRIINNRYYERLLSKESSGQGTREAELPPLPYSHKKRLLPLLTLLMLCALVPLSLAI